MSEEFHIRRSDDSGNKNLLRLLTSGNRNLTHACEADPDPDPVCLGNGCDDEDEQPWGLDAGIANRRDEAPKCMGDDTTPCHVRVTLADLAAHTNDLGYCQKIDKCQNCPTSQIFTPKEDRIVGPGGYYHKPLLCDNSYQYDPITGRVKTSCYEHPVNSINGVYDWPDFNNSSSGIYKCCFTTELQDGAGNSIFTSDPDDYEWCYKRSGGKVLDREERIWELHILMEFRNNRGGIYGEGGGESDHGDISEYNIPDGVKLSISIPWLMSNGSHTVADLCNEDIRSCKSTSTLPDDECDEEDLTRCEEEQWHASTVPETVWATANVFRGFIPKDNYNCLGTNVFHNQLLTPSGYQDPSFCDMWAGKTQLHPNQLRYIIPYYFGGTVTVAPYNI